MRGEAEQIADRLLDGFEAGEDIYLVTAFSRRLPLEVICVLLGLPRQDSDVFSVWAKTATSMRSSFGMFRAFLSMRGVVDYVREQIEECRLHPREGVIGELVRAEEDGDKLSEDELISMVFLLLLAGANYDPAMFDEPDRLKLDRFPNPHLVFSSGIHFCLGMQLARVEAQSALARLYARYPDLALASPDDIQWIKRFGLRGVTELPVRLNAGRVRKAA